MIDCLMDSRSIETNEAEIAADFLALAYQIQCLYERLRHRYGETGRKRGVRIANWIEGEPLLYVQMAQEFERGLVR